jgi:hypothetical protein
VYARYKIECRFQVIHYVYTLFAVCYRQIDPSGTVAGVCNIQKGDQIVEVPFFIHPSFIFVSCFGNVKILNRSRSCKKNLKRIKSTFVAFYIISGLYILKQGMPTPHYVLLVRAL